MKGSLAALAKHLMHTSSGSRATYDTHRITCYIQGGASRTVCMILRTRVTVTPRCTSLSAIQPPTLLVTAIVIQGSTLKMPLFIRSKCSTWL